MRGKTDCHKDYYLVQHSVDNFYTVIVSHSGYDHAVIHLDEIEKNWYFLPTYEIEMIEIDGAWLSDHQYVGTQIVIDCEVVNMVELEKFEDVLNLPSGFRRVYG